jgi:hypothetical protein
VIKIQAITGKVVEDVSSKDENESAARGDSREVWTWHEAARARRRCPVRLPDHATLVADDSEKWGKVVKLRILQAHSLRCTPCQKCKEPECFPRNG